MKIIEKQEFNHRDFSQFSFLVQKVMNCANLTDKQFDEILNPPVLSDPYQASGLLEVGKRLKEILLNKEKILVCGDYDADGICATTILVNAFQLVGIDCGFYIPDRLSEGYGLSVKTVKSALDKGYRNFITVDNGVKAIEAMKVIKEAGASLILTDHHHYEEDEINCDYFLHPLVMGEPFHTLSGAGVACLIARMLLKESKESVILAGVASVADCMEVFGETRSLIRLGINYLNQGYYPAINALKNNPYDKMDEGVIGFQIAPKLNGTGRMADLAKANNTVRYLLSKERELIDSGCTQINEINEIRKKVTKQMVEIANQQITDQFFQIVSDSSFHEGVVGLVASKLANELKKPVMVLSLGEGVYKGSIRSVENLDLRDFFKGCQHLLNRYGGHKMAAGISFNEENYDEIVDYIHKNSENLDLGEETLECIDVEESDFTLENVEDLRLVAPFGNGFEEPIFSVMIEVKSVTTMSNELHLKVVSEKGIEYIYFNQGKLANTFKTGDKVQMIGHVSINKFRNVKKISFNVMETVSF